MSAVDDYSREHPFAPSGWNPTVSLRVVPDVDPVGAVLRRLQEQGRGASDVNENMLPSSGDKDLNVILAELRNLRRKVDGATIAAVCTGAGAITVTLTWGS